MLRLIINGLRRLIHGQRRRAYGAAEAFDLWLIASTEHHSVAIHTAREDPPLYSCKLRGTMPGGRRYEISATGPSLRAVLEQTLKQAEGGSLFP